jgi:cytochrome c-type biogenesis protein CcmH
VIAYLSMAALALLAAVWMSRPFWRGGSDALLRRRAANVAVYRTRLAELEAEVEAKLIEPATAEQIRQELGVRLVQDVDLPAEGAAPAIATRRWSVVGLLVLLLLGFSALGYWQQGSWRTQQMIETAQRDPQAGQQLAIEDMIQRLAERLQQQPDDLDGWAMLGRSYFMLNRYAEAAQAYGEANRRAVPPDAGLLVGEGESLAMARDRDLSGRPRELFEAALKAEPEMGKALWYAGMAAAQERDFRTARDRWQRLAQQEQLPPELKQALDQRLAEMAELLGEASAATVAAVAPPDQATEEAPAAASESPVKLRLRVALSDELAARMPPGSTLFVFAKAAQGPPMPLAVQRLTDARLPLEISLDDSMAMMPQMKLSLFDQWVVTARVSASGGVKAESGDWEGSRPVSRVESAQPIDLRIDRIVP